MCSSSEAVGICPLCGTRTKQCLLMPIREAVDVPNLVPASSVGHFITFLIENNPVPSVKALDTHEDEMDLKICIACVHLLNSCMLFSSRKLQNGHIKVMSMTSDSILEESTNYVKEVAANEAPPPLEVTKTLSPKPASPGLQTTSTLPSRPIVLLKPVTPRPMIYSSPLFKSGRLQFTSNKTPSTYSIPSNDLKRIFGTNNSPSPPLSSPKLPDSHPISQDSNCETENSTEDANSESSKLNGPTKPSSLGKDGAEDINSLTKKLSTSCTETSKSPSDIQDLNSIVNSTTLNTDKLSKNSLLQNAKSPPGSSIKQTMSSEPTISTEGIVGPPTPPVEATDTLVDEVTTTVAGKRPQSLDLEETSAQPPHLSDTHSRSVTPTKPQDRADHGKHGDQPQSCSSPARSPERRSPRLTGSPRKDSPVRQNLGGNLSEVIVGASQSSDGQHLVSLLQKVTAAKIVSSSPPIVRSNKFFSFSCKKQVSEEPAEINNISVPPIVNDSPSTETLNSVPVIAPETKQQNCELLTNTPPIVSHTGLSSNPPHTSVTRANSYHFTITSNSSESVTEIQSQSQTNEVTNSTFQAQNILDLINNAESAESNNLPNITPCSTVIPDKGNSDSYVTVPNSRTIYQLVIENCKSESNTTLTKTPCNSPDIPDDPDDSKNWRSPKPFTNISIPYFPCKVHLTSDQQSTSTQNLAVKRPKGILKPMYPDSVLTTKSETRKIKFSLEKQIRFFLKSPEEHLADTSEYPDSSDTDNDESEVDDEDCYSNLVDQWTAENTLANSSLTATRIPAETATHEGCSDKGVILNIANGGDGPEMTSEESIPAINVIEKNSMDTVNDNLQSSSEVKSQVIPDQIEDKLTPKSDSKSQSHSEHKKEKEHKKSDSKTGDLEKKKIEKQNISSEKKSNSGKEAKMESKSKSKESKSTKVSKNKLSSTHTLPSSKDIHKHKKTGETRKEKEPKVDSHGSAFKMKLSEISGTLSSSNEKNASENSSENKTTNEKGGTIESNPKDKLQKEATLEEKEKWLDKLRIKGGEKKEEAPTKTFKNIVGDFNAMKNNTQLLKNRKAQNYPKMFEIRISTETDDSLVSANIDSDKIIGASSSLNTNSCIDEPISDVLNSANVSNSEINSHPSNLIFQGTSILMPIIENNKTESISRLENSKEITTPTQLISAKASNKSLPMVIPPRKKVPSCTKSVRVPKTSKKVSALLGKVKRPRGRPPKIQKIETDTSLSDDNLSISSPTPSKTPVSCSLSDPPSQQLELIDKQKSSCSTGGVFKISISEMGSISNNLTVFNTETEQTITLVNSAHVDSKQNLQSDTDSESIPSVKIRWEPQYYAQEIIEDNENNVLKIKASYKFCMDRMFSSYVNMGHRCDQSDQSVPPSSSKVNTESGSSLACHELSHVDVTEANPGSSRRALRDMQDSEASEYKDAVTDNVLLPPSQNLTTPKTGRKRKVSSDNQSPCPKQKKDKTLNLPS